MKFGALEKARSQQGKHDGRCVKLSELILVDKSLIFSWFRSVSFINVRITESCRLEKDSKIRR